MTVAVRIDEASSASNYYITHSHSRTIVWTADDVGYLFYVDAVSSSTGAVAYVKTTDGGVNWSSPTRVCNQSSGFDVYYSKWTDSSFAAYIHIYGHDDAASTRGVRYNRLDPATDTLLNGNTGTQIASVGVNPYGGVVTCAVARSGKIHCVGPTVHKISSDNGVTWTDGDSSFGQAVDDNGWLFPDGVSADTEDMLMLWHDNSAATARVLQYDSSGGAWGAATDIAYFHASGTRLHGVQQWSATYNRANGLIYLAMYDNDPYDGSEPGNEETAAMNLRTYEINGTTATPRTNVLTNTQFCSAVALVRFSTGVVRAYYALDTELDGYDREQLIYYKESSDAMVTWGAQTLYSTAPQAYISVINVDPAPVHDNENGAAYQFSLFDGDDSSAIWYEITPDSGDPPVVPPTDTPIMFQCMDGVDGVGVVSFTIDGLRVFRGNDVDGAAVVSFEVNSYPVLGGSR